MASILEMQKAKELMKGGLDLKTAVAQARTPVTATSQINHDRLAQNQAIRQANPVAPVVPATPAPITPAPIVQAPVNTTGLSTPLAPAVQPVTNTATTQVAPKVDATPGITQDSFNQAKTESEKIKAQNEAVMAQNKQQAELKTQERQQIAQETAQASIPTDQKGIVNALVSGMSVVEQPTQAYRNAKVVADNFKRFNGMTDVQLLDNLKQGQIGTELDSLLSQNPNYAKAKAELAKAQKTASINRATQIASNVIKGKETPVVDDLANIEAKYQPPLGANAQAYQDYVVNNEDVKTAGSQVKQLSTQISDLSKTYNDALKQIKKDYPSMPASALLTLMGSRTNDTKELLDSYINAKELAKGDFDMAMKMAEGSYGAFTLDRAEQQQIASEQRQMQAQKDLLQYKSDFEKQQAEMALQDPATQIGQTMKEFADMGIVAQGSLASKVAEANDVIAKGGTLGQYVSNLRNQFMSKPEYQKIQALQQGQLSDAEKFSMQNAVEDRRDLRNFAQQKELAQFNNDLNRQEFLFNIENDPEQKAKAIALENSLNANKSLFDILGKNVGTYEGNRGYDLAGNLGDPLPAGGNWTVKSIDTAGEQVGSIFIGGKGKKPYGNTVVMQDENGNEIRYSHLQDIGVKQGDILGFGDIVGTRGNTGNVMGANGEKLTAEQLKAGRGAHLDVEIKSNGKLLSNADQVTFLKGLKGQGDMTPSSIDYFNSATPTDKKKLQSDPTFQSFQTTKSNVMNDENASIYDVMKYSQGGKDMGEERLKSLGKFSQGLSQIADLSKSINETTTGPIIGRLSSYNPYDSNAQALIAQINSIVPNIARGVYGEVGVLTDADIQNYAKTLPNIKSTEDTNKLVLAMTLNTMLNGFKGQLQIDGSAGRDVSGFGGTVKQYESRINGLLNEIGKGTQANNSQDAELEALYGSIPN